MRDRRARRLGAARYCGSVSAVLRNRVKAVALVAKVVEVRIGKPVVSTIGINFEDGHNPGWIGIGQWPQQHAVHDGKDRSGRADSERKRKNRYGGETAILA